MTLDEKGHSKGFAFVEFERQVSILSRMSDHSPTLSY